MIRRNDRNGGNSEAKVYRGSQSGIPAQSLAPFEPRIEIESIYLARIAAPGQRRYRIDSAEESR